MNAFFGTCANLSSLPGQGENHGLLNGLELASFLKKSIGSTVELATRFYDGAYDRWQQGILSSEKRLSGIHKSPEEWRKVAEMQRQSQKATATKS